MNELKPNQVKESLKATFDETATPSESDVLLSVENGKGFATTIISFSLNKEKGKYAHSTICVVGSKKRNAVDVYSANGTMFFHRVFQAYVSEDFELYFDSDELAKTLIAYGFGNDKVVLDYTNCYTPIEVTHSLELRLANCRNYSTTLKHSEAKGKEYLREAVNKYYNGLDFEESKVTLSVELMERLIKIAKKERRTTVTIRDIQKPTSPISISLNNNIDDPIAVVAAPFIR